MTHDEEQAGEDVFTQATNYIEQHHDQFQQADLLKFYGLFKQATVGKCNTAKPGIFNLSGRSKWSAWNELGEMSRNDAKQGYVALLSALKDDWNEPSEGNIEQAKSSWASVSCFAQEADQIEPADETIINFIKEGDEKRVNELLSTFGENLKPEEVNELDADGLGLIHWAADRGNVTILKMLLAVPGLQVNLRDSTGQTALHYASSCGHAACAKLLVASGVDKTILDEDGMSCLDVAHDAEMKTILL